MVKLNPATYLRVLAICAAVLLRAAGVAQTDALVELEAERRFVSGATLSSDGGSVAQTTDTLDFSFPVAGGKKAGLGMDLFIERAKYRFSHFDDFVPGATAAFSHAHRVSIQPTLAITPHGDWIYVLSAEGTYTGASGAHFSQSLVGDVSLAAVYRWSDQLRVGVGMELYKRMPNSLCLLPFPIIEWRAGNWTLLALDGESGRLAYTIREWVRVFGQLEFRSEDLRLAANSWLPNGILHYETFPLALGFEFRTGRHFTITVLGGSYVAQQYRFEDSHGRVAKISRDSSPLFGGLNGKWSF